MNPRISKKLQKAVRVTQQGTAATLAVATLVPVAVLGAPATSNVVPESLRNATALSLQHCGTRGDVYESIQRGEKVRIPQAKRVQVQHAGEYTSGGADSCAPAAQWDFNTRDFMDARLSKADIEAVRGGTAVEPVQVYVNKDHAGGDPAQRGAFAFQELKRLGAFDRSHLVVMSPTGTGWINLVALQAIELLTRGDVSIASIQYSTLPSTLSLDKLDDQKEGLTVLYSLIREEVDARKARGESVPEVLAFGESLGAWGTQDMLLDKGGDGFSEFGIDKAVFFGSPAGSGFHDEVVDDRGGSLYPGVEEIADAQELVAQPASGSVDYVFLRHANDPIVQTGVSLLWKEPHDWPRDRDWKPVLSFFSMLKALPGSTASVPGLFNNSEHVHTADAPGIFNVMLNANLDATDFKALYTFLEKEDEHRRVPNVPDPVSMLRRRARDVTPSPEATPSSPTGAGPNPGPV